MDKLQQKTSEMRKNKGEKIHERLWFVINFGLDNLANLLCLPKLIWYNNKQCFQKKGAHNILQERGLVCTVCGTENDKKAKFCNECGNKLKQEKACPVFEKNKEEQGITDKRFGSGLMADDFKFGEEIDEKQKVFWSYINRD